MPRTYEETVSSLCITLEVSGPAARVAAVVEWGLAEGEVAEE